MLSFPCRMAAVFAALISLLSFSSALAVTPSLVNVQGVLTDPSGAPEVGTFNVTFSIYGLSFGGTPQWTETFDVTTDSSGRFSVVLGQITPLDEDVFGVGLRYLGITVPPDPELPRQQLVSVPYSLRTATIDGASGGQVLGDLDLAGEITAQGTTSFIRFLYNTFAELPDPAASHGALAHVHDSGAVFFAHAGQWVRLASQSELLKISLLSSPDGDPDTAVVVDTVGNVHVQGLLNGLGGPLQIGVNGLVVNGLVVVNGPAVNLNALLNINNGAQVGGGNLVVVGPRRLVVQNLAEVELEPGARLVTRSTSALRIDTGTEWTSSSRLLTEAEVEIETPGYLRVLDPNSSDMSTLELDRLDMNKGARTMELRPEDLTITGGRFDIVAPELGVTTTVPVEMVALSLTGAPGLSVSGPGGVSVTGAGGLTTSPGSPVQIQGPSVFMQPITAPLQVGVGPAGAGALHVVGNITATGAKLFVQDHPTDPTKEIHYIALEGGEAGTYMRGTAVLNGGRAVIDLPEHFSLVTGEEGLTAQLTPRGPVQSMLYVESLTNRRVVVKASNPGDGQVAFDFLVQGVRSGFEGHQPIVDREQVAAR